jgi:AraC-like DNA-binding protein
MKVSSFRTSDFEPQNRVEAWSELIWSAIGRLHTQAQPPRDFNGHVQFGDVGGMKLCRAAIQTPHRVARTSELIRRDDRGVLKVVFQLKGCALIEQCGRQLALRPGEWSIYDASKPYVVINPEAIEFLAMLVPRERLFKAHADVSRFTLLRSSATAGLGRLISTYVGVLLDDMSGLDVLAERQLVDSALELVQLAVTEQNRPARAPPVYVVSKERIKAYIHRHLRDPDFSIEMIAAVMHCSKRHLHKMFNEGGETLSHFLWNSRLDRCRADLNNPELRNRSITQIAFSWGFNNAAHFSRCFKARFGASPTEYRLSSAPCTAPRPNRRVAVHVLNAPKPCSLPE